MFDYWQFFRPSKKTPLYVSKYKVIPKSLKEDITDLGNQEQLESLKLELIKTLSMIRQQCIIDIEKFNSGTPGVFPEFQKNRSLYCRRGKITLFVKIIKINKDNYVRIFYSPYLEFIDKLRVEGKHSTLIEIVKNFRAEIVSAHRVIPNQIRVSE